MPVVVHRGAVLSAVVVAVLLGVPSAALAHGVGGSSETVYGFVWLGTKHMLTGWDHLLFVGGVLLLAGTVRRAAKLISLFALGHSITLFTATVADWHVNPTAVDIVVALSLVFLGVVGLLRQPKNWAWFGAAVLGFGLIHGLGLSTRLQEVGLPDDGMIPRVLAFNVGVEVGQLAAVLGMYMLGDVLRTYVPRLRDVRLSHSVLIAAGIVAAGLLAVTGGEAERPVQAAVGSCQVRDRTETFPTGGGHAGEDFTEPGEPAELKSFGHVIGDGFAIVQYNPVLSADQLTQLRTYVTNPASGRVVGGAAAEQSEPVKVVHAYNTLVCAEFDLPAVQAFVSGWFDDPRSKPIE
jgi:hydrogenase/urease accessory protein HupE